MAALSAWKDTIIMASSNADKPMIRKVHIDRSILSVFLIDNATNDAIF